ncbi:UPF0481 protein At3g47200-like [Alnus glutinosa]|uniref:UPF0481 protein At3g47200-like n=1 Tax=Alnus glutinosa TaxID=3517 RepID=UPI002D7665D5|nr:UPF0481 protein At3g47200-like [Alnus glutinosa]
MEKKDSDSIICIGIDSDESDDLFAKINISSEQHPPEWPGCCIYRVHQKLRKINEKAYTPKLISIGPFHHSGNEFKDMEKHKVRYFEDFLKRTRKRKEDLLEIIKVEEEKISHCYSEKQISFCYSKDCMLESDNHFVKMILLDAVFIIELFLKVQAYKVRKNEDQDYILRKPWLLTGIAYDLILLENQVPFFILEKLFMSAYNIVSPCYNHGGEDAPFVKLSRNFFEPYDNDKESIIDKEVKHFTDLLRYFLCPKQDLKMKVPDLKMKPHKDCLDNHPSNKEKGLDNRICATKLEDAGLKFKGIYHKRLLDIGFITNPCLRIFPCFNLSWLLACLPCLKKISLLKRMRPILEVPVFVINDYTEVIFRNLVALEQCHYPSKTYICNYTALLVFLINSVEDVDLLVEKRIIDNRIGSNKAVAELISKLCEVCVDIVGTPQSYYSDIDEEIRTYSDSQWNRHMGNIKRKYFSDFWKGAATIFGAFVLLHQLWGWVRPFVMDK